MWIIQNVNHSNCETPKMWNLENRKCECENGDQQRYIKTHENNFNKNKTIFERYKHLVSTLLTGSK